MLYRFSRAAILAAASITIYLSVAGSASAAWFIEGSELAGSAALASTAKTDKSFVLTGGGLTVTCTGSLEASSPEIKASSTLAAKSLIFTGCTVSPTLCTVPTTLGTLPVTAELEEGTYPADKTVIKPSTGTVFTTIKVTGEGCAAEGNKPVTGDFNTSLPTGQEEQARQLLEPNQSATGLLKLGSSSATLTGAALLGLTTGKQWGAAPSAPATNCPIESKKVSLKATVTTGNEATLREEVVNDTRIPVGESGTCSEVAKFTTGVSEGKITTSQSEAYKAKIAELVVPGAEIYAFEWHETGGSKETFTTLGIFNAGAEVEFEPIGTWGKSSVTEKTPVEQKGPLNWELTLEWNRWSAFRTGYNVKVVMKVDPNGIKIKKDEAEASANATILWKVAAEKEETLETEESGLQCYKVTTIIFYTSGFKSISVTGTTGGWSLGVTLSGSLGESGREEYHHFVCADGTKG